MKIGFPNGFESVKLHYFNDWFKTKDIALEYGSNDRWYFLRTYATEVTNIYNTTCLIFLITNIILYIYLCKHILKEYDYLIAINRDIGEPRR